MLRRTLPLVPPALVWGGLVIAATGCAFATFDLGFFCAREALAIRGAALPEHAPIASNPNASMPALQDGLANALIAPRSFDELVRFSTKFAGEHRIDLVQLQSEAVNTAPTHLSQARIRLKVRGDYGATKAFLISVLKNYPGLTLEHLAICRNSTRGIATPSTPGSQGPDDNSTIELLQYGMPSRVGL